MRLCRVGCGIQATCDFCLPARRSNGSAGAEAKNAVTSQGNVCRRYWAKTTQPCAASSSRASGCRTPISMTAIV